MALSEFQLNEVRRRQMMQKIIDHPKAFADLLLKIMDRLEAHDWDRLESAERSITSDASVRNYVDGEMEALLKIDPITRERR